MYKRILFIAILITIVVKFSCAQIPGLTITTEKDREEIYLKSKTVWITLTPFFLVERKFSPDQGETWQNVGMFGGKIKPYVQNDSIARHNLKSYQLTRMFGLAQMWVISPLLAYKHFTTTPGVVSTGDSRIDNNVVLEEETGYLTAAIIIFCTGTITYHVLSKGALFKTLERYNYILGNKMDFEYVSMNMFITVDPISQTPQLSLIWTF